MLGVWISLEEYDLIIRINGRFLEWDATSRNKIAVERTLNEAVGRGGVACMAGRLAK